MAEETKTCNKGACNKFIAKPTSHNDYLIVSTNATGDELNLKVKGDPGNIGAALVAAMAADQSLYYIIKAAILLTEQRPKESKLNP